MVIRCSNTHRYNPHFQDLPEDQSESRGRHTCAACAYEQGFRSGLKREVPPSISFDQLPESQAGIVRHKSPLVAWARGYADGFQDSYTLKSV